MKVAAILVLIFGFSLANPLLKSPESDNYVDQVLENLRQKIAEENLDPAPLPDGEASFSQDIGFITLHGSAKVYDGFFRGIQTGFKLTTILDFFFKVSVLLQETEKPHLLLMLKMECWP